MNSNQTIEYSLCSGCLSVDRKLQLLNEENKLYFCGLLNFNHSQPISLCFECSALMQRLINFKKQVNRAHTCLHEYLKKHKLKPLSKLGCSKVRLDNFTDATNSLIHILKNNEKSKISTRADAVKNEYDIDDKLNQFLDENSKTTEQKSQETAGKSHKTDQTINKREQSCTEPLAFIKVEEQAEGVDDGWDDLDFQNGSDKFSDSDDEPLTVKKYKNNQRRIKKKHESPSPKRRKEQPSGVVRDPRVAKKLRDLNVEDGHIALVLLSWEEVQEERRALLSSSQFTAHAHRCAHCAVGYNHHHKLVEHNRKHSLEAGTEVCDVCTIRCKSRAALASHKRRHRARWVCQYCGARYSQACVAADHCARAHGAARPTHRCPHCAHTAASLGALRMHIKSHSSRPECALCGKTFRDKSSLRTHAFVHKGVKEHACAICDKTFMFKKQKEIHETTHLEHQHLYCHQCDVSFKNQTSFYQHLKYNLKHIAPADIKYACKLCDKRFVKAKRLEEHNLAVHLKLAPIKCSVPDCTFSCPSRAALRSHMRVTHRGAPARVTHVCHRCGHTYKSKKSLEGHLRTHDNVTTSQITNIAAVSLSQRKI